MNSIMVLHQGGDASVFRGNATRCRQARGLLFLATSLVVSLPSRSTIPLAPANARCSSPDNTPWAFPCSNQGNQAMRRANTALLLLVLASPLLLIWARPAEPPALVAHPLPAVSPEAI